MFDEVVHRFLLGHHADDVVFNLQLLDDLDYVVGYCIHGSDERSVGRGPVGTGTAVEVIWELRQSDRHVTVWTLLKEIGYQKTVWPDDLKSWDKVDTETWFWSECL